MEAHSRTPVSLVLDHSSSHAPSIFHLQTVSAGMRAAAFASSAPAKQVEDPPSPRLAELGRWRGIVEIGLIPPAPWRAVEWGSDAQTVGGGYTVCVICRGSAVATATATATAPTIAILITTASSPARIRVRMALVLPGLVGELKVLGIGSPRRRKLLGHRGTMVGSVLLGELGIRAKELVQLPLLLLLALPLLPLLLSTVLFDLLLEHALLRQLLAGSGVNLVRRNTLELG